MLRLVFIEWTTGYGLYPFFAIGLLLVSIVGFTLVYLFPLYRDGIRAIHRIWPADRLDTHSGRAKLAGEVKVERLRLRSLKKVLQYALWFSVLNAFHLGWRELNVGTWLARVQTREYTLRADGWVRTVAGVQSLLSVYLLAIWALTYFGQPFQ